MHKVGIEVMEQDPLGLTRSIYYAPIPIMAIDVDQSVIDFNLALQVLMEGDIEGARFRPMDHLAAKLEDHMEGDMLSNPFVPIDDRVSNDKNKKSLDVVRSSSYCRYLSRRFGWIDLERAVVKHIQPLTGTPLGATMYYRVLNAERDTEFWSRVDSERHRRLTWESYALSYDRVLPVLPFYQEVVRRHLEAMNGRNTKRILELGAGTGNLTVELLNEGHTVTSVDLSRAMLEKLAEKVPHAHADALTAVEQNAERLPQWEDASFDGVSVLLAFYDMAHPDSALREAMRLLRPGGTIVITEPKRCFQLDDLLGNAERILRDKGVYASLKSDWDRVNSANRVLDPSARKERLFVEDIECLLGREGYEDLMVRDSHFGNCATVCGTRPKGAQTSGSHNCNRQQES